MKTNDRRIDIKDAQKAVESTSPMSVKYSDNDLLLLDNVGKIAERSHERVNMNVIVACTQGTSQTEINGITTTLSHGEVMVLPPNTATGNVLLSPDFECRVLCMSSKITYALLRPYVNVWNQALYANAICKVKLTDIEMSAHRGLWETLNKYLGNDVSNPYHKDIMLSLMRATLLGLCNALERNLGHDAHSSQPTSMSLFHRFLDLLNEEGSKRHPVIYYSDKLCISPKYLSLVCKSTSGKTAKQWIEDFTLENVRYYLRSTDYSMKEIADMLGFPNASYLGRYVKEHFGMTPLTYRRGADE